jgi:hypothetical protein
MVEMFDYPLVGVITPVMEIRCVEIGVEQSRRLKEPARTDVVL